MRAIPATLIALSLLAATASAQSPADALRSEPKSVALKDIPDDFRAVTLGGNSDISTWMLFGLGTGGGNNRPSERLLLHSLSAFWVQPDEFAELLDGKRPRIRGYRLDLAALASTGTKVVPVFTESWLEAGRIVTWSPSPELSKAALTKAFTEAESSTAGSATEAETTMATEAAGAAVAMDGTTRMKSLMSIATAVLMYAGDNHDRFPKAAASSALPGLLGPYVKNLSTFETSPQSGRVLYNTSLSDVKWASLKGSSTILLLWEERAWPDGKRAIAFADGSVKRLDGAGWSRVWNRELHRRAAAQQKAAVQQK